MLVTNTIHDDYLLLFFGFILWLIQKIGQILVLFYVFWWIGLIQQENEETSGHHLPSAPIKTPRVDFCWVEWYKKKYFHSGKYQPDICDPLQGFGVHVSIQVERGKRKKIYIYGISIFS